MTTYVVSLLFVKAKVDAVVLSFLPYDFMTFNCLNLDENSKMEKQLHAV